MAEITRNELIYILEARGRLEDKADVILARMGDVWRSCRNDPPKVGVHVWACDGPSKCHQSQYEAWIEYNPIHGDVWTDWGDSEPDPAYWRPLPSPPKGERVMADQSSPIPDPELIARLEAKVAELKAIIETEEVLHLKTLQAALNLAGNARDRVKALEIAAVKAVIPLEALRLLGPSCVSSELWTGIVEGSDAVRATLSQSGEG